MSDLTKGIRRGRLSQKLTVDNVEIFADLFRRLLVDRPYTHIQAYEYAGWEPEVYWGETASKVTTSITDGEASIFVSGTTWSWGPCSYLGAPVIHVDMDKEEIRYRWITPEGKGAWTVVFPEPQQDGGEKP